MPEDLTDVESESPGFYVTAVRVSEAVYCANIVNAIFAYYAAKKHAKFAYNGCVPGTIMAYLT